MLEIIKNGWGTYAFAIIIIGYFFKGLFDLAKVRNVNIELEKFLLKIKNIRRELEELEETVVPAKLEVQKIKYFDDLLNEPSEFMEGYKIIKNVGISYFKALKRKGYKGVNSSSYFNEEEILLSNFNTSRITQRSSAYVGLGLLGTFTGIVMGLSQLGNAQTTTSQISLIDEILPSMSLAFITSILGITCSLFYSKLEKTWIGEILSNILKIENNLNLIFPNQEEVMRYLEDIEISLRNLSQGLGKNLGASVAQSIGDNTRSLFNGFNKEIQNLGNNISSKIGVVFNEVFNKEFIQEFKDIHASLTKMNRTILNTNKATEALLSGMPEYTEKFENLNNTSIKIFETSERATKNYDKFLIEVQRIEEVMKQLNIFKSEVTEMIKYSNENIVENSQKLEELSKATYEIYIKIGQEIKQLFESGRIETSSLLKSSNSILEQNLSSVNSINIKMGETLNTLEKNFNTTQQAVLKNIKSLGVAIDKNKNIIEEEYQKMANSQNTLASKTKEALADFDNTVYKLNKEIAEVLSNIKDMVGK